MPVLRRGGGRRCIAAGQEPVGRGSSALVHDGRPELGGGQHRLGHGRGHQTPPHQRHRREALGTQPREFQPECQQRQVVGASSVPFMALLPLPASPCIYFYLPLSRSILFSSGYNSIEAGQHSRDSQSHVILNHESLEQVRPPSRGTWLP